MKPANTHIALSAMTRALLVLAMLAAAFATTACSKKSESAGNLPLPGASRVRPAMLQTTEPAAPAASNVALHDKTGVKPPASKLLLYRSRDYGVSFTYPWQYAFLSAKAVATGSESLKPKPDGHDGQFTLARVEIPHGFYADTNYDSGYFILSLNQDLSEEECNSVLNPGNDGKVETEIINGVEFHRLDNDSGGRGRATRLRQYVAYTDGICYELELGVKTSNEDGLARDVDPEQVMRRLDTMMKSVRITPANEKPAVAVVESSSAGPAPQEEQQ